MKKYLLLSLVLVSSLFLTGCAKKTTKETVVQPTIAPTEVPEKPVEETIGIRPYVALTVSSDGHWLTLEVKNIVKGTTGLEYELTYFADAEGSRIERGVSTGGKPVDLAGQTEFSKKLLLGSASCTTGTCKYKYDNNVTEGMLTIKLVGSSETAKYSSAFRLQKGSEAKVGFSTGDGVFLMTSSSLTANSLYLTISSIGVPVTLPAGVLVKSLPYLIYPNITAKGTVSFKTTLSDVSVYGLSGKAWQKLVTTVVNGKATADFSNMSLFVLTQ